MIYKNLFGEKISQLGLGMMRLPTINGNEGMIDEAAAFELVDYAIEHGINYFDTAWGYHCGNSELIAGSALSRYPRDRYYLASKFPGYDLLNMGKTEEIFEEQLKKCKTDYFDYYLIHNVCEMNIEAYLDPSYDTYPYLLEQKRNGRIRHLGFSAHGSMDIIKRFLDYYGDIVEFCQLQINWFDWEFQRARDKYSMITDRGLPVWIMEPLRGGKLAKIDESYCDRLQSYRPDETVPGWAFRFLQSLPNVGVILSGMSSMEQLQLNLQTFERNQPLNDQEFTELLAIASEMMSKKTLPCTACHYCVSYCPKELDIPRLLELYNEHVFTGGGFMAPMAISALVPEKRPQACIGCRSCEAVCPQNIKISEAMAHFQSIL